jgi:hypothetical protein
MTPVFSGAEEDRPHIDVRRFYLVGVVSAFLPWDADLRVVPAIGSTALPREKFRYITSINSGLTVVQGADAIRRVAALFPEAKCGASKRAVPQAPPSTKPPTDSQ